MATLAQVMRLRKNGVRIVLGKLRQVDKVQEIVERFLERLLKRRQKIPTLGDLNVILSALKITDKLLNETIGAIDQATTLFKQSLEIDLNTKAARALWGFSEKELREGMQAIAKKAKEIFDRYKEVTPEFPGGPVK